jgi:hypothetical protein
MPVERRGQVIGIEVVRVNGKPEELDGLDGRRQPLVGGTSRISREVYVRICERLGVKFPGATRRWETGRRSGASARAHPRLYKVASRHLAGNAQTADLACERFWKAASFAPRLLPTADSARLLALAAVVGRLCPRPCRCEPEFHPRRRLAQRR